MSIDRPESSGPPMFDLTKQPDAHTYYRSPITNGGPGSDPFEGVRGKQRLVGDPILYIVAEQLYETGLTRECRIRIDLNVFLSSKHRAGILESEAFNALASIGVKL